MSEHRATIIDGKAIAQTIRSEIAAEVRRLSETHRKVPGLAVVIVGQRKDSQSYVSMKRKACAEVGIKSIDLDLSEDISEDELIRKVHELNDNHDVHGWLAMKFFMNISLVLGYCWTRTAERQAYRLRTRYLKAVMRQDVGYFDLHVTSTAEVIESVSSDSLVIQDSISEKVPVFVMNLSTFFGSYVVAFILLWRLAIVGFPFVVLLVIPGLMYGRALMSIARKIKDEYNKAGVIVEQALSSVRTVYSFVGESKTIAAYSAALQGTVKLGLSQGLAKGLAIGSNGVVFAIWSFMSYYGSRLVMYHDAKGGTVFAVGAAIAIGGL